jgi:8-oxo-dGTP pyrophosphatase MutT (NUDIX family)
MTDVLQQIQQFLKASPRAHQGIGKDILDAFKPYARSTLPGHITASAFILDQSQRHVLLIQHVGLGRWLQPGGHVDPGETPLQAAIREALEETGLKIQALTTEIMDIDIHRIPASSRKQEPAHYHLDLRYLFVAEDDHVELNEEECGGYRWVKLTDLLTVPEDAFRRFAKKAIETLQELNRDALA